MASTSTNLPIQHQHNDLQSPSGTTVRSNGLLFLRTSWQNISRASKFMLVSSVFFIVSQMIVSIVMLALYSNDTCDKPLGTYLIVHTARIGLLLPLLIYQYLHRPTLLQRQQRQNDQRMEIQREYRRQREMATASRAQPSSSYTPSSSSPSSSSTTTTTSSLPTQEHPSTIPRVNPLQEQNNNNIKEWCERIKSLLDLFGILWFIVGNYLIFTTENCSYLARHFYYTILVWVLLSYIIILIPVILCASVIFCLPVVLVILRILNITEVPGMPMGASQEEILKIPIYKYQLQENESTTPATPSSFASQRNTINSPSWTRRLFLRFKKTKNDVEDRSYPSITIPQVEDALCSICLSEYEPGDLICKLWCSHHFHKDCVHEWLALNSLCPLCKQNFRGKDYNQEQDSPSDPITEPPRS
ncbi:uncharacterized protein BX664DRAFT_348005 [Halteromyces radiatus]|uniref:uncharacterized protein n=1 Tax=Halteromyces radiatus TaxID=101107 RepID=UPI002220DB32|nr:uncharacterized protein BX664DRAFT_348005 [Halteromyces radiatus]KAI8092739.1 hypothetical protein BX664DRAFT_348005 [Halteromyces radiatus]